MKQAYIFGISAFAALGTAAALAISVPRVDAAADAKLASVLPGIAGSAMPPETTFFASRPAAAAGTYVACDREAARDARRQSKAEHMRVKAMKARLAAERYARIADAIESVRYYR
jgi:hypothetical protein